MTSLNISLPKALKQYVEKRVARGAYSTPSEYIRELIRNDQKRRTQEKLDLALLEGLNSGPAAEINAPTGSRSGENFARGVNPRRSRGETR